ncbi:hypothetical protein FEDK69T_06750 [Flavobacterium enshiense DK69]|uniref:AI-2E family transporter n=1 Tax=Flavobacterium enshiense TaxID=1341165 RepID=UPI0003C6370C|nr:AI-2E family transporter [Flavobacterium enshiense]ESU24236.1 hypothetical protein FEDK69T_06750 [Flavobacterium enshiense DK69]
MKNNSDFNSKTLFDLILQLGMIFLIMGFCIRLLLPFTMPILWAIIFAIILYPLYNFVQKKLKGRGGLAAFLIITVILLLIIVPTITFFNSVVGSIIDVKDQMEAGTLKIDTPAEKMKDWPIIGDKIYNFLSSASVNIEKAVVDYKEQIVEVSKIALGGIVSSGLTFLQIILSLIIAGFLMASKSSQDLASDLIMRVAGPKKGEQVINITVSTVYQVVKGILGVAVIQTIIQAFGLFLCGVPFAGVLTLICLILSILQIGPIIVNIGVIVYLFSTGDSTTTAILWSIFFAVSGLSDNVLKPLLLGKGASVPMLVIFLGVIGGFMMSGFIGLFVGPIVFSIGYQLFDAWVEEGKVHAKENIKRSTTDIEESHEGVEL